MASHDGPRVTVLGLGAMGRALAGAVLDAGCSTTVWNRSGGRAGGLVEQGATEAGGPGDAVTGSPLVVACLLDHASVHEVLDPVVGALAGRSLVNVTTTTPNQARELATWAGDHDIRYLDGGIMAVPEMIGRRGAAVLYSGDRGVFDEHRQLLDRWAESTYLGDDAGMASLQDLAMLAGMYLLFGGFLHGTAMVASAGVSATEFASRATPFLAAMTAALPDFAETIDRGDYTGDGQQSLEFSDLSDLVRASTEAGISAELVDALQAVIAREIGAGFGTHGFARIHEALRGRS